MEWLLSGIVAPLVLLMLKDVWARQNKIAPRAAADALWWGIFGGIIVLIMVWLTGLMLKWKRYELFGDVWFFLLWVLGVGSILYAYNRLATAKPEPPPSSE
jgi:hypothetical protein